MATDINLNDMTRKQLEKLGKDVSKALDRLHKKDLKKVRLEMEKLAAAHGVRVEDVLGGTKAAPRKSTKATKAKSPPKYANPSDASQTWTGRGRQPVWYKTEIEAGATPESMAV